MDGLTDSDAKFIELAAIETFLAWKRNRGVAKALQVEEPACLIAVHKPPTFSYDTPAEIFVVSNDQTALKFFSTPTQTFAAAERIEIAQTPRETRFYRIRQGPADEALYGPRSPMRPLLCEVDGTGGFSEQKILFAMQRIAPLALAKIPGIVVRDTSKSKKSGED